MHPVPPSASGAVAPAGTGDPALDDPEALLALAVRSFARAKRAAIAENDRLGVPSHGARDGVITTRHPPEPNQA